MTKLIRVLDDYSEFKLNFSIGSHNVILFEDDRLKINLIKLIFNMCERNLRSTPYVISGFNLKPYLNLFDNIYDKLSIDLNIKSHHKLTFIRYCEIFEFKNFNSEFYLLNNFDKLKSMFIVSLFSGNEVVLFDNAYSLEVGDYVEFILDLVKKFNLFSNRVFIEIKKASHSLN